MGGEHPGAEGNELVGDGCLGSCQTGKEASRDLPPGGMGGLGGGRLVGPDGPRRKATPEPILRCDLACDFNRGRGVVENRASLLMRVGGHRSCWGWETGGQHRGILGPRLNTEAGLWAERAVGVQTMSTERALQKQD